MFIQDPNLEPQVRNSQSFFLEVPGEELEQIVVDCTEIAAIAIQFANDVSEKILGSSNERQELIDDITRMQEEFTLFPEMDMQKANNATEHWMAWLAAPDVAIDENAYDNLLSNI